MPLPGGWISPGRGRDGIVLWILGFRHAPGSDPKGREGRGREVRKGAAFSPAAGGDRFHYGKRISAVSTDGRFLIRSGQRSRIPIIDPAIERASIALLVAFDAIRAPGAPLLEEERRVRGQRLAAHIFSPLFRIGRALGPDSPPMITQC